MMLAALERGCHVLCEKPTAMNRFQAAEMRDAASVERGRVAAINHEFRFFPARRYAVELAQQGAIGTPRARRDPRALRALAAARVARHDLALRPAGGAAGSSERWARITPTACGMFFGEPRTVLASVRVDQPRRGPAAEQPEGAIATADDACTRPLRVRRRRHRR